MICSEDDELTCIGAGAIEGGTQQYDTTSDGCEWVRQYTDWTDFPSPPSARMLRERSAAIEFPALADVDSEHERVADHCMAL